MIDWKLYSLKYVLNYEKKIYFKNNVTYFLNKTAKTEEYYIYKFQKYLRKAEYYKFKNNRLLYYINVRKKNILGIKLGFSVHCDCIDLGLHIYHASPFVINGTAKIGKNFQVMGNICIGNKKMNNEYVPKICDNVTFGWNVVVYGDIFVCDNVFIGANSLITTSIYQSGVYKGIISASNFI